MEFLQSKLDCCLVIDGESLQVRISAGFECCGADWSAQLCLNLFTNEFIEIATKLSAVVACRCSPTQKADVARLIRKHTKKRVCCIGDGGNDVSMIQAADVGEFDISRSPRFFGFILTMGPRGWYRRKRGQTGFTRRRLFRYPIQPSDQTPHVARSKLLQAFGQTGSVRHSQRTDHLDHAGRVLRHLLLRAYCPVPGLVDGRVRDCVYYGPGLLVGPG